jgi:GntR family transcriptional regulator
MPRVTAVPNTPPFNPSALAQKSPVPLYYRLYAILRERITNGAHPVGSILPSEAELTEAFKVSRITAKRALDELAAEGLVVRTRGRGTTVTGRASAVISARPIMASIDGLLENLNTIGRETSVEVIEFGYTAPPDFVRQQLALAAGIRVQRAVRVRSLDGEPLSQSTTFVPERIGRAWRDRDLAITPLIDLLERTGIVVGAAEQSLSATAADTLTAPRLKVGVGMPLLLMKRCVKDINGEPVQYIEILYRPDRFEYRMSLTREQTLGHGRFPASSKSKQDGRSPPLPNRNRTRRGVS